jgi:hypothetical protein
MSTLYREIVVWRRIAPTEAIRYACFEDLDTGRFCVQLADFIHAPHDDAQSSRLRLELLLEGQLDECEWHDDLKTAIATHDALFENDFKPPAAAPAATSGRSRSTPPRGRREKAPATPRRASP